MVLSREERKKKAIERDALKKKNEDEKDENDRNQLIDLENANDERDLIDERMKHIKDELVELAEQRRNLTLFIGRIRHNINRKNKRKEPVKTKHDAWMEEMKGFGKVKPPEWKLS